MQEFLINFLQYEMIIRMTVKADEYNGSYFSAHKESTYAVTYTNFSVQVRTHCTVLTFRDHIAFDFIVPTIF
jgi:hypothetical protein